MTSMTSGIHHRDPESYVSPFPRLVRHRHPDRALPESCIYGPGCTRRSRPEFDNHNRVLVAFRMIDGGRGEYADWLRDFDENPGFWMRGNGVEGRYPQYTPEHIVHARRVLTKLAALTKED